MGLYDSFVPPEGLRCPECGGELHHFQTKAFPEPAMGSYKIGEVLLNAEWGDDLYVVDGFADCISTCKNCRASVRGKARIREHRYAGLEIVRVEARTT